MSLAIQHRINLQMWKGIKFNCIVYKEWNSVHQCLGGPLQMRSGSLPACQTITANTARENRKDRWVWVMFLCVYPHLVQKAGCKEWMSQSMCSSKKRFDREKTRAPRCNLAQNTIFSGLIFKVFSGLLRERARGRRKETHQLKLSVISVITQVLSGSF